MASESGSVAATLVELLDRLEVEEPWRERAACRGEDPDLFFPERGERPTAAQAICRGCPVRAECLEHADTYEASGQEHGVWGGLSATDRRSLVRRGERPTRELTCPVCGERFSTQQPDAMYCGRRCSHKAVQRRSNQRASRWKAEAVEPPSEICAWPGCDDDRSDGALCGVHARRVFAGGNGWCRWPECPRPPSAGEPLCYAHGKVARGLMELEGHGVGAGG